MKRILAAAVFAFVLSPVPSSADELARYLPPSTIAYLEVPDAAATKTRFEGSPVGKILAQPGFVELRKYLVEYGGRSARGWEKGLEDALGTDLDGLLSLLQGEVALAVLPATEEGGRPRFALSLDARANLPLLQKVVARLAERKEDAARTGRHLSAFETMWYESRQVFAGSRLVASDDPGVLEALAPDAREVTGLAGFAPFKEALARVSPGPHDVFLYVNVEGVFNAIAEELDDEALRWIDSLGLYGIHYAAIAEDLSEGGSGTRAFISTPGEKKTGLLRLLASGDASPALESRIPENALAWSVDRLDLPGAWSVTREVVMAAEPEEWAEFAERLAEREREAGVTLETFLGRFGDSFTAYTTLPPLGGALPDTYWLVPVKDGAALADELARLCQVTGILGVEKIELQGRTIHSIEIAPGERLKPDAAATIEGLRAAGLPASFLLDGDTLVAANTGQALQRWILAGEHGPAGRSTAAVREPYCLRFETDQRRTFGHVYNTFLPILRAVLAVLGSDREMTSGGRFQADLIPPAEAFAEHLLPWSATVRCTPEGVLVVADSIAGRSALAPAVGMVAATLVPTLVQVKENASRARCKSNLKQIGLGSILYADEHRDRYPPFGPAFWDGVREELEDPMCYVCPSTGDDAGDTSYATWSGGEPLTSAQLARNGSRVPLAWDKDIENHGDVRNVLFHDGHVEQFQEDDFQVLLREWEDLLGLKR
ncbi:MAG: hypothetical protein HY720_27745 [Planctomycetes bacterium]|nr:hypothetical protein [Planctomycetota bacterium]